MILTIARSSFSSNRWSNEYEYTVLTFFLYRKNTKKNRQRALISSPYFLWLPVDVILSYVNTRTCCPFCSTHPCVLLTKHKLLHNGVPRLPFRGRGRVCMYVFVWSKKITTKKCNTSTIYHTINTSNTLLYCTSKEAYRKIAFVGQHKAALQLRCIPSVGGKRLIQAPTRWTHRLSVHAGPAANVLTTPVSVHLTDYCCTGVVPKICHQLSSCCASRLLLSIRWNPGLVVYHPRTPTTSSTCCFSLGCSHAVDLFAIANLIAGKQAGAMPDNGAGAAAFRVQNQIRRNAQDMQEYLADLGSWEKSIKKKDKWAITDLFVPCVGLRLWGTLR